MSAATLSSLLDDPLLRCEQIAAHLDALNPGERVRQCRALCGRKMRRLYDLASAAAPLEIEALVSGVMAEGETVRFAGKNSLPVFSTFEKHFARLRGEVIGINVQPLSFATGPGYFTIAKSGPQELLFDYTRVPNLVPPGWPAPRGNMLGLSRFVFGGMLDYNRRVARDVIIGCATRGGRPMGQTYILARLA